MRALHALTLSTASKGGRALRSLKSGGMAFNGVLQRWAFTTTWTACMDPANGSRY